MNVQARLGISGLLIVLGAALHGCRGAEVRESEARRGETAQPAGAAEAAPDSAAAVDRAVVDRASAERPAAVDLPREALERVAAFFAARATARYMEQDCGSTTYPGWDGYPLLRCRYEVTDSDERRKSAEVIMLNPSPETLAVWIVDACLAVRGSADRECTETLSRRIHDQSGGQFPVAGIVFEDNLPADGVYEAYGFRDGVTVGIEGVEHRGTGQPSEEEIHASLFGRVTWSGLYARLQGTTREQYRASGGTVAVGDSSRSNRKLAWLDVVRELYQAAWDTQRNELLIAWARANL